MRDNPILGNVRQVRTCPACVATRRDHYLRLRVAVLSATLSSVGCSFGVAVILYQIGFSGMVSIAYVFGSSATAASILTVIALNARRRHLTRIPCPHVRGLRSGAEAE